MKNQFKLIAFTATFLAATLWISSCEKNKENSNVAPSGLSLQLGEKSYFIDPDSISSLSTKNARGVDGSLLYKLQGTILNYNQLKAFRITSNSIRFGNPYLLQSYTNSGLIGTFVCRLVGNSFIPIGDMSSSSALNKVVFTRAQAEGNSDLYLCFLGKSYLSNFDFALYSLPPAFPATAILDKTSTTTNIFTTNGQCVWYEFGRIAELYNSNYISKESYDFILNGLSGKSNRHARYWPSMIGGDWLGGTSTGLEDKYKKRGMLVVWKFGSYGHIALAESISEDLKTYTISDFNRNEDEKYGTKTYTFGSDKLGGVYPIFLPLKLTN